MDLISGDDRNDVVCAGPGNDRFFGGDGNDTIDGNFWYPSFASLVIIVDIER
ncbi:hypothetical protein AB3480_32405 [Rhizobium mongolense]|uniref:hypothetical protein n=1 Tax=Rhizobium mongolense TaxID=57676 RepID=UPI0034A3F6ED